MLIISKMKCDSCNKEFKDVSQGAQFWCNRCNKHFTLCPKCKDDWTCDYCGSNDLRDIYEDYEIKHGNKQLY